MEDDIVQETFDRLTRGIPKAELRLFISEATDCEEAIQKDLQALENVLAGTDDPAANAAVDEMMESPFSPLDRYWTASSLLGRLRGSMAPPPKPGNSSTAPKPKASKASVPSGATSNQEAQRLLELQDHPAYTQPVPTATILACWKKIFANRAAIVFKKPVKDEEAPGYSERIQFPMDLGLVRKMIVTKHITTFQQLHTYIALIAHNCVKYNGRETDYGIVARDFEAMADEAIRLAVLNVDHEAGRASAPLPTSVEASYAQTKRPASNVPPSMVSEDSRMRSA